MVSVILSSKFKSLYRDATGQLKAPLSRGVQRITPMDDAEDRADEQVVVPAQIPTEAKRVMQPGKRALRFEGISLISARSDVLSDDCHYKLDIFQRSDGFFVLRLNKVDAFETVRLLLTCEASSVEQVINILKQVDAAKYISVFASQTNPPKTQSQQDVYLEMNSKLQRARSEYAEFIGSIFADHERR